jgi:uncharacterized membrane protein HdeD (DUF308 family)
MLERQPTTEVSEMSTMLQQAQQVAGEELKPVRWALGISGALSVLFGVAIIVWPSISLSALVILFGAFAFARGVIGLVAAISGRVRYERGWLAVASLAGIAVGVLVFVWPNISALALLYVIGAYAIALGIITVGGAFWLPLESGDRILLAVTGFVSILFGIVMFAKPGDGALVLLALIAAYALVIGIAELTVAIGGRRLLARVSADLLTPAGGQASH